MRKKLVFLLGIMIVTSLMYSGCASKEDNQSSINEAVEAATLVEESDADTENTEVNDDVDETDEEVEMEVPSLRDIVPETIGARIGCAVTGSEIDDPKVWEIITTHFNAVTLGNELKPDALVDYSVSNCAKTEVAELNGKQIEVPVLSYKRAEKILDKIYDWNQANPDKLIKVRGHVLVWHSQTPEWFFHEGYDKKNDYVSPEVMNERLEWYIKTVLTHFTGEDSKYKDMFYGWDVVNEAISDATGKLRTDSENSEPLSADRHGSNSSWYHIYQNNDFIINAFTYANKYAPEELELYYNDYNECNTIKRNGILELLADIKAHEGPRGEGTRISAMGMQGHYDMSQPDATAVEYSAKAYAEIVGQVQVTELDLRASDSYNGSDESKEDEYEKQRKRYNMIYYSLKSANNTSGCDVTGITFWGTVDQYSWLQSRSDVGGGSKDSKPQCPLLFDDNYLPKPCFYVFAQ